MFTGIDINASRKYVSQNDPDKENPTVFLIGSLDPVVRAELEDESSLYEMSSQNPDDKTKVQLNLNKRQMTAVRFGLKGMENFLDPKTLNPVPFKTEKMMYAGKMRDAVPESMLAMIPHALRMELAEEVLNEAYLSEQEEKN